MVTGLLQRLAVHRGIALWGVRSRPRCLCSAAAGMTDDPAPAAAGKNAKKEVAAARRDESAGPAKKAKAAAERTSIPRAEMSRRAAPGGPSFKALSWNVAGLRGLLNNGNGRVLQDLVESEQPDVICLQEHKLQATHVGECETQLRQLLGPRYGAFYWAVSTEKKGYSGIVVVCKGPHASTTMAAGGAPVTKQQASLGQEGPWGAAGAVLSCRFGLGADGAHSVEGRCLSLEFERFWVVCLYCPNSGEGLKRLDYRLGEWERDLRAHVAFLSAKGKPVVLGGDLNVAYRDEDIYNVTAPHIKKSAGCTPQERSAFGQLCSETGLVDSLVHIHPGVTGAFSYWSQRAGNRPFNRGLRLDYWLVSTHMTAPQAATPRLHDAFLCADSTPGVSDHCPVGVTIEL